MKKILSLFIFFFSFFVFLSAQSTTDRGSSLEVVRLVTDATTKLNGIYKERVQGHEDEHATLRKTIYATNTELLSIRSLLAGSYTIQGEQYAMLQKPLAELQTAIDAVEPSMNNPDIQKTISNVGIKAKTLKAVISKINKNK